MSNENEVEPREGERCENCGGAGWLWGHELPDQSEPYRATGRDDNRYSCPYCKDERAARQPAAAAEPMLPRRYIDTEIERMGKEHDAEMAELESHLAAAKAENERLKEWLGDLHSSVGRDKHKEPEWNYRCALSAILDIKQDAHETREELSALTAEAERMRWAVQRIADIAANAREASMPCEVLIAITDHALAASAGGQDPEKSTPET